MRPGSMALLALTSILLLAGGLRAQQGPLGIKLVPVPDALYAHLPNLEHGQGLLVETIKPGSRAAEIGLKPYDVLVAVGTTPVKSGELIESKLTTLLPGEREVLQIVRGGKSFALTVATPAQPM